MLAGGMITHMRRDVCFYAEVRKQNQQLYLSSPHLPKLGYRDALMTALSPRVLNEPLQEVVHDQSSSTPLSLPFKGCRLVDLLTSAAPHANVLFSSQVHDLSDVSNRYRVRPENDDSVDEESARGDDDESVYVPEDVMHSVLLRHIQGQLQPKLLEQCLVPSSRKSVDGLGSEGFLSAELVPCDISSAAHKHQRLVDVMRQRFLPDWSHLERGVPLRGTNRYTLMGETPVLGKRLLSETQKYVDEAISTLHAGSHVLPDATIEVEQVIPNVFSMGRNGVCELCRLLCHCSSRQLHNIATQPVSLQQPTWVFPYATVLITADSGAEVSRLTPLFSITKSVRQYATPPAIVLQNTNFNHSDIENTSMTWVEEPITQAPSLEHGASSPLSFASWKELARKVTLKEQTQGAPGLCIDKLQDWQTMLSSVRILSQDLVMILPSVAKPPLVKSRVANLLNSDYIFRSLAFSSTARRGLQELCDVPSITSLLGLPRSIKLQSCPPALSAGHVSRRVDALPGRFVSGYKPLHAEATEERVRARALAHKIMSAQLIPESEPPESGCLERATSALHSTARAPMKTIPTGAPGHDASDTSCAQKPRAVPLSGSPEGGSQSSVGTRKLFIGRHTFDGPVQKSLSELCDILVGISHGGPNDGHPGPREKNLSAGLHESEVTEAQSLIEKLLKQASGSSGFLAVLPESISSQVPLMAAILIWRYIQAESLSVVWVLPECILSHCQRFWNQFRQLVPKAPEAYDLSSARDVGERNCKDCKLGLLSLQSLQVDGSMKQSEVNSFGATLVVLTASAVDLAACISVGEQLLGTSEAVFIGIICGLPLGGSKVLAPMCSALRVRHLLIRTDEDIDVRQMSKMRRNITYAMPTALADLHFQLDAEMAQEFETLFNQDDELRQIECSSSSLKSFISSLPRDVDQSFFWKVMTCFCIRRILDFFEDEDAMGFCGFMTQVKTKMALGQAFQKSRELHQVTEQHMVIERLLEETRGAKHTSLNSAIKFAKKELLFCSPTAGQRDRKHGIVLMQSLERAESLSAEFKKVLEESKPQILLVTMEMAIEHLRNWLKRFRQSPQGGTLLVLMSVEKLSSLSDGGSMLDFPWKEFLVAFSIGTLPRLHQLCLDMQPGLTVFSICRTSIYTPLHPHDSISSTPYEGSDNGTDVDGKTFVDREKKGRGPSPLSETAVALRTAQGIAYDDVVDVSSLLLSRPSEERDMRCSSTSSGPADGRFSSPPLFIGEALLALPRMVHLLSRHGVSLIECSTNLPHMIVDHQTALLVFEESELGQPDRAIAMARACEVSFLSLWLLVLLPDHQLSSKSIGTPQPNERRAPNDRSEQAWERTRFLVASLASSLLKIHVRMTSWADCWDTLQKILFLRLPHPIGVPPHSKIASECIDETQHEALLVHCGLNALSARYVLQHYTLTDFLGIPPGIRHANFGWIPHNALLVLSAVVDGDGDEICLREVDVPRSPASPQLKSSSQHDCSRSPSVNEVERCSSYDFEDACASHRRISGTELDHLPSRHTEDREHYLNLLRARRLRFAGSTGQTRLTWSETPGMEESKAPSRCNGARYDSRGSEAWAQGLHPRQYVGDRSNSAATIAKQDWRQPEQQAGMPKRGTKRVYGGSHGMRNLNK